MSQASAIAVIGAGKLGSLHARALRRLDPGQPAWIVDVDLDRAAQLAAEVGARHAADAAEILDQIGAAIVATPTEFHAQIARAAIAAGSHCLIEKPITSTVAEAESLLALAHRCGRHIQVGHIERFNPIFRRLRDEIGMPAFVESERLAPFVSRSLDVDVVRDLMVHDLDLLLSVIPFEPDIVDAVGVAVLTPREDIANAHLRFPNGTVANLTASRVSQEKVRKIRFFSSSGYLSLDLLRRSARRVAVRAALPSAGHSSPAFAISEETIAAAEGDALTAQMQSFLTVVRDGRLPEVSGEAGLRVLRIAERIAGCVSESLQRFSTSLGTPAAGGHAQSRPADSR